MYLISMVSFAQESLHNEKNNTHCVTAIVKIAGSAKGKVRFAIYDSEENFKNRKFEAVASAGIENGISKVTFSGLPSKNYAIICYHDVNNNKRLDFQSNGMPMEDYGATNNIFNYGPPRFDDAKFELKDKDLTFEIKFM